MSGGLITGARGTKRLPLLFKDGSLADCVTAGNAVAGILAIFCCIYATRLSQSLLYYNAGGGAPSMTPSSRPVFAGFLPQLLAYHYPDEQARGPHAQAAAPAPPSSAAPAAGVTAPTPSSDFNIEFFHSSQYFQFVFILRVAFWSLVFGLVCDIMDGFVARLRSASSPFGADLDSLADLITFLCK
eukprot:g12567.t1